MTDQGVANRRFPRYHAKVDVIIYLSTKVAQGHITQISRGGCLILPSLPSQPSPGVKMSFRLSEELPYINCKAEIVYNMIDKGTGIAFTEISQFNQDLITEFFNKQVAAEKPAGASPPSSG